MKRKIIFYVSLFLSVQGIFSTFWYAFRDFFSDKPLLYHIFYRLFNSYSFYPLTEQYNLNIDGTGYSTDLMNLFLYLTFLVGAILYYFSDNKENRLLRFNFSLIFLSSLKSVIYIFFSVFDDRNLDTAIIAVRLVNFVLTITFLYGSFWGLKYLSEQQQFKIQEVQKKETISRIFVMSSLWKRLFHLTLDSLFVYIIIHEFVKTAFYNETFGNFIKATEAIFGERLGLLIFILLVRLLYYIPFEYFIGATPAKLLTQTRVVNVSGKKPSFKAIIIRTLCRFIPFEAISFFFKANWHDNFSETYVIEEERKGVNGWVYFAVLFPIILGIMFFHLYKMF